MSGITVHMIVKNEEQWIWYALASIVDYVEKILVYDTGSTDKTLELIQLFQSKKIIFRQKGNVTSTQLVGLRNEQIEETRTDWFMLVDGDEVWPKKTISEFVDTISEAKTETIGIVVPTVVPVGDLFHFQPESTGRYQLLGKTGHLNMRGYRISKDYSWEGKYPLEAYVDERDIPIQENKSALKILKNSYWHMTHMIRSHVNTHAKRKLEIGEKRKEILPEVFFEIRPEKVPSPWVTFDIQERLKAQIVTPVLTLKRMFY